MRDPNPKSQLVLIVVAIIGVLGSTAPAVIYNWDKLFSHSNEQAPIAARSSTAGAAHPPTVTSTPESALTSAAAARADPAQPDEPDSANSEQPAADVAGSSQPIDTVGTGESSAASAASSSVATISQATSPEPTAANSSPIVTDVELGSSIGVDNQITEPSLAFGQDDAIHASVATDGPSSALSVKWTYEGSKLVASQEKDVPAGPQVTEFSIEKPSGWPLGQYELEVSINSRTVASRSFQVVRQP